jgi:amidase
MTEAIEALRAAGATIVDPADIPSVIATEEARNILRWPICSGTGSAKGRDQDCSVVFKYGMKRDFNAWLASLGSAAPVKSLTELRAWNRVHERAGTLKYGQAQLDISDEMDLEADRARYLADREKDVQLAGRDGIDAALRAHTLDALLFPAFLGASIAARPGYPSIIVPFGTVPNDAAGLPAGFSPRPAPFGVTFTAGACSEPRLIEIAYAFEQATKRRVAPRFE